MTGDRSDQRCFIPRRYSWKIGAQSRRQRWAPQIETRHSPVIETGRRIGRPRPQSLRPELRNLPLKLSREFSEIVQSCEKRDQARIVFSRHADERRLATQAPEVGEEERLRNRGDVKEMVQHRLVWRTIRRERESRLSPEGEVLVHDHAAPRPTKLIAACR